MEPWGHPINSFRIHQGTILKYKRICAIYLSLYKALGTWLDILSTYGMCLCVGHTDKSLRED